MCLSSSSSLCSGLAIKWPIVVAPKNLVGGFTPILKLVCLRPEAIERENDFVMGYGRLFRVLYGILVFLAVNLYLPVM